MKTSSRRTFLKFDPSYTPMPVTQYGFFGPTDGASPLSL
jgi:hypothetical protein